MTVGREKELAASAKSPNQRRCFKPIYHSPAHGAMVNITRRFGPIPSQMRGWWPPTVTHVLSGQAHFIDGWSTARKGKSRWRASTSLSRRHAVTTTHIDRKHTRR